MGFWLSLWLGLGSFAGPVADFCGGSELVASLQVLAAEREVARRSPQIEAHRDRVLGDLDEVEDVLSSALSRPWKEYRATVEAYLIQLQKPVKLEPLEKKIFRRMAALIQSQEGTDEVREALLKKLRASGIVSLHRVLEGIEGLPESNRRRTQAMLPAACGKDGLGRGGIAFDWRGERVFAFCPGALLHAAVDGKGWMNDPEPGALWFTAFHELGHVLGASPFSPHRALYTPLVRCLSTKTAPIPARYQDESIADFWGAVGLGALLTEGKLGEQEQVALVARNLAPFRQGGLFSRHHLPFGARLQIVRLELCRAMEKRPLQESDCRLTLGR